MDPYYKEKPYSPWTTDLKNTLSSVCSKENTVNLSDFRTENTIFMETTPMKPLQENRAPSQQIFQPSEITARSTMNFEKKLKSMGSSSYNYNKDSGAYSKGIEDILAGSYSEDVQKFYRESLGHQKSMSLPRTADMSRTTSMSSVDSKKTDKDFWDVSTIAPIEFNDSRLKSQKTLEQSECFTPAEEMYEQLENDGIQWENEVAPIPTKSFKSNVKQNKGCSDSLWEEKSYAPVNASMGQYFKEKSENLMDIIPHISPEKRSNRVALVDVTNSEESILDSDKLVERFDLQKMAKVLNKLDTPTSFVNRLCKNKLKPERDVSTASSSHQSSSQKIDHLLSDLDKTKSFSESMLQDDEISELNKVYERLSNYGIDPLKRNENCVGSRGKKRRSSTAISDETPKSAMSPIKRSRSPNNKRELIAAAAASKLRPPVPTPRKETPEKSSKYKSDSETSSNTLSIDREFYSANTQLSPANSGKYSLPSYGLRKPSSHTFTSPTNSVKSERLMGSYNSAHYGAPLKRTTSACSTGSGRSEFDDESQTLKFTHRRMSWETVKLRKSSVKSLNVKNVTIRKINIKINVEGPGFKLYSMELQGGVTLSPSEVRTIAVEYCPTVIGPAIGSLRIETHTGIYSKIDLYAYGGHVALHIDGVQKGPYGPHFLTMGNLNELAKDRYLDQSIMLSNTGNLPGFAVLAVEKSSCRNDFAIADAVTIEPNRMLIEPGCKVEVRIRLKPTRDQMRNILQRMSDVITLGEIYVISGDEATRLRLLKYPQQLDKKYIKMLSTKLPKQEKVEQGLSNFDEELRAGKISHLLGIVKGIGFSLTINRSLDETQVCYHEVSLSDETQLDFETFYENMESHSEQRVYESKKIHIHPAFVFFLKPIDDLKSPKNFTIKSLAKHEKIICEISSNVPELLTLHPTCTEILPGEVIDVKVYASFYPRNQENIFIEIMMANSKVSVPVKFFQ